MTSSGPVCQVYAPDTLDVAVESEGRPVVVVHRHRSAQAAADVQADLGSNKE